MKEEEKYLVDRGWEQPTGSRTFWKHPEIISTKAKPKRTLFTLEEAVTLEKKKERQNDRV